MNRDSMGIVVALFAAWLGPVPIAHAGVSFQLAKVLDTNTPVPGEAGVTFGDVDEPPRLSDGSVNVQLEFGVPSIEGHWSAAVGATPVELARVGGPMPDGVSTVSQFGSEAFDISGANVVFAPRRTSTGNDTLFATLAGTLQLVIEENVTSIPDGSGDLFTSVQTSDTAPIFREIVAFEAFGPSGKNGIYARVDGTLQKIAQTGDASPDASTYSGSFDEPHVQGQDVVFEARTDSDATQGIFGVVNGTAITAATTNTTVPGQVDAFTFLDNPSISGSVVLFNGDSASVVEGIYSVNVIPTVGTPTKIVERGDAVPGVPNQTFTDLGDEAISLGGGLIGFEGDFGTGEEGIFASVGGTLLNVIDSTQMLEGKQVNRVDFDGDGVDANQIAFTVIFDDNSEAVYIASMDCPATLAFASQTISGYLEQLASSSIALGPNLVVDAADIEMHSPTITFANGTGIRGTFRASNTTTCPP